MQVCPDGCGTSTSKPAMTVPSPRILDTLLDVRDRERNIPHILGELNQAAEVSNACGTDSSLETTTCSGLSATEIKLTTKTTTSTFASNNDDNEAPMDGLYDDSYVAIGVIKLYLCGYEHSKSKYLIQGRDGSEVYPSPWLMAAVHKTWVRLEEVFPKELGELGHLRVYLLPEDVERGSRGSLRDFRKFVRHLLPFIDRSESAWFNGSFSSSQRQIYETPTTPQEESLFYIFNTLRSPCPNLDYFDTSTYNHLAVTDVMTDSIQGLTTQLYPYQRRSVSAMIQREAEPAKILDPRKIVYNDLRGRPFYLDVCEGTLVQTPPLYDEPKGGILAETMGYGKTLICIALILATKGHYPKVPQDRVDSVPFRPREKVASLLAMAARRAKHEGVPWKVEFDAMHKAGYKFDRCLAELAKYNREYAEPIFTPTTPDRKGKREPANIVRLCSSTLIVVPPNLVTQWQHEIHKHTTTDALEVLVIDTPGKEIPCWQQLIKYDVVIITKARFEQEYRDDDLNQGKTQRGESRYRSSLTEVRWLRVICDEGHGFAGSSSRTNAMAMLDKMYIERRWVVSGTPSSTLHGVEVGLAATNTSVDDSLSAAEVAVTRKDSLKMALSKRKAPSARDLEAKDLERLRLIVVNFLRLRPWANQRGSSDVANWKKYLAPFEDADGLHHTSPALREVLQSLIIRHRIEDIDTDLTLPPLHNRVVYLEPAYHDKLAINMFFLVLTSNYVTSEREDEDYMFHPRNRKKLDHLISNLRQATFHWVGFSEHDIRETLRISNEYFDRNIDKISDQDGLLLTEAIINGERALADPSWRAFSKLHEIGVYIKHFPDHARESWALDGQVDDPVLLGTVQAREAQKYLKERLKLSSIDDLTGTDILSSFAGAGVRAMNLAKNRAENENEVQQKAKAKLAENEKVRVGASEEPKLFGGSMSMPSRVKAGKKPSSMSTKRRRSSNTASASLITPPASPGSSLIAPTMRHLCSPLTKTRIASFTSSKLNYLVSRLLNLTPGTKSLVFYQHNNTAFFIAEALELFSISFRIYANTLSVSQRNSYLSDFNSKDSEIQVLLMDVKQASHGLHVACASYVCIVCPIWDASVESQAVKRAHRIGQTNEVVVETLVLRDTFEEEMVRRRRWKDEHLDADQDNAETGTLSENSQPTEFNLPNVPGPRKGQPRSSSTGKGLLDDRHMVNVIKDVKFMKFGPDEELGRHEVKDMDVPEQKRNMFGFLLSESSETSNVSAEETANSHEHADAHLHRTKFRKLNTLHRSRFEGKS